MWIRRGEGSSAVVILMEGPSRGSVASETKEVGREVW